MALEQRESLKAESAAADIFSAVSDRVAVLEKAFGDLADAVSDELTAARAERKKWSDELTAARGVVAACDEKTKQCVERCDALQTTFDDHEAARLEARTAASAVVEARAVLAEAERRAAETAERLQSLRDVAHDADAVRVRDHHGPLEEARLLDPGGAGHLPVAVERVPGREDRVVALLASREDRRPARTVPKPATTPRQSLHSTATPERRCSRKSLATGPRRTRRVAPPK